MRYRGLPRPVRVLLWGLVVVAVLYGLSATAGDAIASVQRWLGQESDSLPWYATRVLGFLAYGMLAASVVYGLLLSTGILDAVAHRVVSFALHQELAALGIALTAIHGAVLTLDTFVPASVYQVIVPFATTYRPEWVGIGQLAFFLMVIGYGSFFARKLVGQRGWRLIHYTTFVAYAGATVHGLMAGSDTGSLWALATYAGSGALVAFLFAYRLVLAASRLIVPAARPDRPSLGERA
jgi:hypothetical protein